jgi:hypothetical protein
MKKDDVPQQHDQSILEGHQRACYALDENGHYVVVGSVGWEVEKIVNGQANDDVREQIVQALERVRRGERSPLLYHMARRQMTAGLLSAYSGISQIRIHWHLRPRVFARLSEQVLYRYADALQIPIAELRCIPAEDNHERL